LPTCSRAVSYFYTALAKSAKTIFCHRCTRIEEDKKPVIRKLSKTSCFYHAFIGVHLRQKPFFGFKYEPGSIFDDFARTVLIFTLLFVKNILSG
jgi:hypothetical protein